jgi:hypothetical protein
VLSNKCILTNICIFAVLFLILYSGTTSAQTGAIPDTENCLYCHRYPMMGRYDKTGKRIFYVNENMFAKSVHSKLRCKSCHVGLDTIPHTNIEKVDCSTKCHIEEPSTSKEFSHKNMINKYEASVHGKGTAENPKPFPEDLPTCKYCHNNRMYNPYPGKWGKSSALSNETMARCLGCHAEVLWTQRFYTHFTHRMDRRRSQLSIVALCTSCHGDQKKMVRHGLEGIETYKDTFHWSQVKYGVEGAPDCISCHVPRGYSTHFIRPKTDPTSPVNFANRVRTCSNQGGQQKCHPGATPEFASGRVHAYGIKARIAAQNNVLKDQTQDISLMTDRAKVDISEEEIFNYTILRIVRLFYQVLIAVAVGSMCLHQLLDYIRTKKRHH